MEETYPYFLILSINISARFLRSDGLFLIAGAAQTQVRTSRQKCVHARIFTGVGAHLFRRLYGVSFNCALNHSEVRPSTPSNRTFSRSGEAQYALITDASELRAEEGT